MQWARAALATIRGGIGVVPARPRLVEPLEAQRDLRALLAIALRRLALLDASAPSFRKLPATDDHTLRPLGSFRRRHHLRRVFRGANERDCGAKRARVRSPRVEVVQLLVGLWVNAQEDTDLPGLGLGLGVGGGVGVGLGP